MNKESRIEELFQSSIETKQASLNEVKTSVANAAEKIVQAFKQQGKVLSCGNGGSAADSQHLSSELLNRFEREREGLAIKDPKAAARKAAAAATKARAKARKSTKVAVNKAGCGIGNVFKKKGKRKKC